MEFGLNLYSVRDLIKTEDGYLNTIKSLKEMGISYVQYSGADFIPERIEKVSNITNIPTILTHVSMDRIINDTFQLMKEHDMFGCKNIGLGAMPQNIIKDKNELFKTIQALDKAGKVMKDTGFKFFYHNHHFEFYKYDGKTILDYIIENTENINITLDTYWVQYGGGDIIDYVRKLKDRIECVHLKDYMITKTEDNKLEPKFAPLGDGNLNFKRIIDEMKKSNVKYFLIEQDNAVDFENPLEQIERSTKYLKSNF